jgi:hypothetical protein
MVHASNHVFGHRDKQYVLTLIQSGGMDGHHQVSLPPFEHLQS